MYIHTYIYLLVVEGEVFPLTDLHIIELYRGDDWMSSFRLSL